MSDLSPILSLPLLQAAQAQKHVTHNEALRLLDVLVQPAVASRTTANPPAFPTAGQRFILPAAPTGAWGGQAGAIAFYEQDTWVFLAPQPGWQAHVLDEGATVTWNGTAWRSTAEAPAAFSQLGVSTTADATNRLAVVGPATLLTHAGSGHQLKINKAAPADTASLLFQTGWSGRAEMGTAGSDGFAIKTSANGSAWITALQLDPASGQASGAAVQGTGKDIATASRLTRVDGALHAALAHYGDYIGSGTAGSWNIDTMQAGEAIMHPAAGHLGTPVPAQPNVTHYWTRCQRIYANGASMQIAVPYRDLTNAPAPEASHVFYRLRPPNAAIWGPWLRQLTQHSLLGPVSQSGGVPTGAVIERGSNANGDYTKFADGTMECWQQIDETSGAWSVADGSLFIRGSSLNWTLPAAFTSVPNAQVSAIRAGAVAVGAKLSGVGTGFVSIIPWASAALTPGSAKHITVRAVGRWF